MRNSLWAAVLLAAGCLVSFRSTYEPDLWWHLAQGREIASRHLVRTNLFSFAYRDYPQPYTPWLFDAGVYELWTRGGPAAIQALQALLIAGTLAVVASACRRRASSASTAAVCAFGWVILEPRALPRPHLLSFLGIAACVYLVERARQARSWKPLRWAPVVIAIWSNVHVECVFGVALLALVAVGEWLRPRDLSRADASKAIGVAALALAATLANPYGIGLLRYTYENSFVPQVISIAELQPPYFPNYRGFFAWAALGASLLAVSWRRVTLADASVIAFAGALGFRYLRLTPLLFLVSAPLVARCIDGLPGLRVNRRMMAAAVAVSALLLARVPVPVLVRDVQAGGNALEPPALFSEPAMQFARERGLAGPVFTSMNLGGYVAWNLYPAASIFVDSRLQAYPPGHFRAIADASTDPQSWASLTAGVDWAVLSVPRVNPFSGVGRFDPAEWGTAYRDAAIEILVRRDGRYRSLARPISR
jgi:hypothetical protein